MNHDKRILILLLILLLVCTVATIASTVTYTTYYPAARGDYQTVRLVPSAAGGDNNQPCNGNADGGLLYFQQSTHTILFCNDGTGKWQTLGEGLWSQNGTNLYANDINWRVGVGTISPGTAKLAVMNGNVGIGTTAPTGNLHIGNGTGDHDLLLDGTNAKMRLLSFGTSGTTWIESGQSWLANSTADLNFSGMYGSPLRMTIKSTGNVGIGIPNPSQKLDVSGNIHASGDIQADSSMTLGSWNRSSWPVMQFLTRTGQAGVGCGYWNNIYDVPAAVGYWPSVVVPVVIYYQEEHGYSQQSILWGPFVYYDWGTGNVVGQMCADQIGTIDGWVQVDIYYSSY